MKFFSTQQAAKILGYTDDAYIRRLIQAGRLNAIKIGKSWGISEESLHQFRVENSIQTKFKALFSFNFELRSTADQYLDKPFSVDSARHAIAQMFLGKSYKTHAATLSLCEKGYGEDAAILIRSLFENFINLKYILSAEDDSRAERYLDFDFVLQKMMLDYAQDKPELLKMIEEREKRPKPNDMDIKTINSMAKKATDQHGFNMVKGWSDKSIKQMSEDIGRGDQYKTVYRLQCQLSHPTPRGMNTYFNRNSEGWVMEIGTNENYIEESLVTAFDFFGSTLDTVGDFLKWNTEQKLSDLLTRYKAEVERLTSNK